MIDKKLTCGLNEWEGYQIVSVLINDLIPVCPIHENFLVKVEESIASEGLKLPLLCANVSLDKLINLNLEVNSYGMCDISEYPNQETGIALFGGNNRLEAAKRLDFTHIDCVIFDWRNENIFIRGNNMKLMRESQKRQQEWFGSAESA
jgi:hypothetical protein